MVNVIGRNRHTPMVADRPGSAPKMMPMAMPRLMKSRTCRLNRF